MCVQFNEAQYLEQLPHVSGAGERYFIESWILRFSNMDFWLFGSNIL